MKLTKIFLALIAVVCATSCNDYLNIEPTGKRIPKNLEDYEPMLRYEYGVHRFDATQSYYLLNDMYLTNSYAGYYPMYKINFNWDESGDRAYYNSSDEGTYYNTYGVISTCNLILEDVPGIQNAPEQDKKEVMAYARVIRAEAYYLLVNYYANAYDKANAANTSGVPLITSAAVNAPYEQVSVQKIYDFIIQDINDALPDLPAMGTTILHPGKGSAYAMLARVNLTMGNYEQALSYADQALAVKADLYDWRAYYETNKGTIVPEGVYTTTKSPMDHKFCENYNFHHATSSSSASGKRVPVDRMKMFEEHDAYALSSWKYRVQGSDISYVAIQSGYFNYGGCRTVEQYLIKAECLARANKINEAMDLLNKVRETRILKDNYKPLTAASQDEALTLIRQRKDNELMFSIVPFADARRFNIEGRNNRTFSKEVDGKTVTLTPQSHMWTFPFPLGAIANSGNGKITQNVEK